MAIGCQGIADMKFSLVSLTPVGASDPVGYHGDIRTGGQSLLVICLLRHAGKRLSLGDMISDYEVQ